MLRRTHTGYLVSSNIWRVIDCQTTMIGRAVFSLLDLPDEEAERLRAMVIAFAECEPEGNA